MAAISALFPAAQKVELYHGGLYSTPVGTTKNIASPSDLPVRRLVRFHEQLSGRLLRELWSDPVTGAYQFNNLRAGTYFALFLDHTGQYGAQVEADIVLPIP